VIKKFGAPPHWHVRKKLESRPARDSRLDLEWIACGLTVESFWTARRRWIGALEGCAWFCVRVELGLSRLESE